MKAILMMQVGKPDVLQLEEIDTPAITAPDQIRVQLKAAGVNPIDTKLRRMGTYFPDQMPAILGCDGAGIIDAVGDDVTRYAPGDRVYFCHGGIGGTPGNYAEYAVLNEANAAPMPGSLSYNEAAAAPLVLITAWEALFDRARLSTGQTVLIHAGAGGVGHVAIQLAKHIGARVITTVGSDEKANLVKELGADEVINYHEQDFVAEALRLTDGEGVDVLFDTVGGQTFEQSFAAIRFYGELVTLLQHPPETDWKIARLRNLHISQELMLSPLFFNLAAPLAHQADILTRCGELFQQGVLKIHIAQSLPMSQASAAHELIESGHQQGKLVLTINTDTEDAK